MPELEISDIDPIVRIAQLSYLSSSYANQLIVAERLKSDSAAGLRASIQRIGEEALKLQEQHGINEEDFFEAVFQPEGWRDRITYKSKGE